MNLVPILWTNSANMTVAHGFMSHRDNKNEEREEMRERGPTIKFFPKFIAPVGSYYEQIEKEQSRLSSKNEHQQRATPLIPPGQ